jgi:outer membrane protein assembly factor BamB
MGRQSAGPLRFAMVTDTHASPARPAAADHLRLVYTAIARRAPDFVLHCGDITDTGLPSEYDLYQQAVPAALRGRIRHVPGNHDVRWDRTAKGVYHARFGPAPYAFDAAGVHFIGFDPTQALLESGHCGRDGLRWLERDLARRPAATPVVVFQHFPLGGDHHDVDDQAVLLDLLADRGGGGILAGHVHREEVTQSHGLTQVTLQAVVNGPVYYWAEQTVAEDGRPVLKISRVTVAADGTQARSPTADILLVADGHGGQRSGMIDSSPARAGGVRGPRVRWRIRLAGSLQGGIAVAGGSVSGGTVVAASTAGEVTAFRAGNRRASALWRIRTGPVYRGPVVDAAGRTVFVPSADQHLYALDDSTGLVRWRFEAGAPVLSAPVLARAGPDREYVVFSAGRDLFAVDAGTGRLAWSVPGRGFSAGRAACDGQRVYTAAADGYARAHDVHTGQEAWSHEMAGGDPHRVALYSGWDNVVALGDGVVIVASVSGSRALEADSGVVRWTFGDGAMYPPAVVLGDGTALFTSEQGVVSRVRLADGSIAWRTDLGVRVQNAGLAVAGDQAWVVPECGGLIGVRLADGREQASVRFTLASVYSAPAVVDGTLIVGDQDGFVHGIGLPPQCRAPAGAAFTAPNARAEDRSEQ